MKVILFFYKASIFAQDEKEEKGNFLHVVSIVSVSSINAAIKIVALIV